MSTDYDIYRVRLTEIKERQGKFDNEIIVFTFEVIEPGVDIRPIESWMDKKNHPMSKVILACRALADCDFNIFTHPRELLIGKECYAMVEGRKITTFISLTDYENETKVVDNG